MKRRIEAEVYSKWSGAEVCLKRRFAPCRGQRGFQGSELRMRRGGAYKSRGLIMVVATTTSGSSS
jgi:hypothetical protein